MANDLTVQYLFRRKSLMLIQSYNRHEGEEVTVMNIDRNKNESSLNDRDGLSNQCEENPCKGVENISIIVQNKKRNRYKKRKKYKVYQYNKKQLSFLIRPLDSDDTSRPVKSHSVPELKPRDFKNKTYKKKVKSSLTLQKKTHHQLNTNFIVNTCCRTCDVPECLNPFINPLIQARIYRCQLNTQDESCCCSCNSDAMFEVMKSLYDCYKKKNCDHCNCILCGHLPREERRLAEMRKEGMDMKEVGVETASQKEQMKQKMAQAKAQGLLTPLAGKTSAQREKILKGLAKLGLPLPEGKTTSEKNLINKVRKELGLPPEPKTAAERERHKRATAAGVLTPLEGKTTAQKENILRKQAELGLELPEGRTASEKALLKTIKAEAEAVKMPSERIRKAKAAGFLTPLEGKTLAQKEKILRGLAKSGMPLPEGKTHSEKKLIQKIGKEMGLPQPKTPSEKHRMTKALAAGIVTPLEGKTPAQKEKILKAMQEAGVPLPEGRTASEKALIAKVKAEGPPEAVKMPSERIRKAKAAGFLTPLEGKTPAQKEKILRGLAKSGMALPEGKTPSEKKLIQKIRREMGLPEPKTPSEKHRMTKALAAGIVTPLEGKTPAQKEKILRAMQEAGVLLPEGRTASEKALIAKVKAEGPPEAVKMPSERMRKAKAAGFLTPLEGKTPAQKEKILRGLAKSGMPLPEGKTPSEKKLIQKIGKEMGLPEPKTPSEKHRMTKALAAGIVTPLEGKTPAQKEKILRAMQEAGVPLPEGRTASEKALIAKVKAEGPPEAVKMPSERIRKAKAAGFLTPLEGKTPAQKEKILRGLAKSGMPLPEGKTPSEVKLIQKVRREMGLPEPKTPSEKHRMTKALAAGVVTPLEGKTPAQKEKILRAMKDAGVPLPEGRTASEKALIAKVKADLRPPSLPSKEAQELDKKTAKVMKEGKGPSDECICALLTPESERGPKLAPGRVPSEKLRAAKAAGLLTPLEGKTPAQKEKIIRGLAKLGLPLPESKTPSEKKLIDRIRNEQGLPPEPRTPSMKERYARATMAGLMTPLEGKTAAQKEKILKGQAAMGIPLPEGRTPSEKALIAKVKAEGIRMPSERIRKAKAAGFLTPLEGKTPAQKEKILRGLAKSGMPLPEGKTPSEKKLIQKIGKEMGLPEPKTPSEKHRMTKALAAGIVTPLEGKTPAQKEKILRAMQEAGVPLPEGRTASEKALIAKVKAEGPPEAVKMPSERIRKAKAAGFLTPLEGKTPAQKEKILRGLAKSGLPLPEGKTPSEKKLIQKIRKEMGLPEPKTPSEKHRITKALGAGIVTPLEGKTPAQKEKILRAMKNAGVPLPEGRTASEKALIAKVKAEGPLEAVKMPSERIRKAKAAGLLTPLEGKKPAQKEKILRGLAKSGMPLPEGKTPSEKKLIQKVRREMGLPEPKTPSEKHRMTKALAAGIVTPLEGKTPAQKEKILRAMQEAGVPLPEGRTTSEKALIAKVKAEGPPEAVKMPSERIRKAKAAGFLTPLEGKTPAQKEKILRGLAKSGLPLPEGKTPSEKKLIQKVRREMGLPEPKTPSEKHRMTKALAAGIVTPLEGKTPAQKEKILRAMQEAGVPLQEGRTASEKALIAKVKAEGPPEAVKLPSERIRKAKAAGFLTPLEGKTPAQKEKILRGLAKSGMPLPEGKTPSEVKLIQKVRREMGLPEPKTPSEKHRMTKALAAGVVTPLEGKTPAQKEKILRAMKDAGVPLPEGRTASEKALIAKVKADLRPPSLPSKEAQELDKKTAKVMKEGKGPSDECICALLTPESERGPKLAPGRVPSEKLRAAKAAGLLTPLEGKTPAQKEKIIRGLAKLGLPLPESKTPSEKKLIDRIRNEQGLPPEPRTPSIKERYARATMAGLMTPLEGKTAAQKEKILKGQAAMGIPLPEGRTPSEKALIAKVKAEGIRMPSERIRKAKAAGFLTPLEGKTPAQKEKILRGLAKSGMPLPEGKTPSEKKLIQKIGKEMGLPEPKTPSEKHRMTKALAAGIVTPLEGKTPAQKEKILRAMQEAGVPLPEGRTASEKALIAKVKAEGPPEAVKIPSERIRKAKAAGFLTPLEGKTPAQKEKILKGLAKSGMPLPEGKTPSEVKLIQKVRKEMGLPEPKTPSEKHRMTKALAAGIVTPLEGKTPAQKEKILRAMQEAGVPLPEGRTASEKALIAKLKAKGVRGAVPEKYRLLDEKTAKIVTEGKGPSDECICPLLTPVLGAPIPSEKLRQAKAEGLLTPLEGKTPSQRERIIRGLTKAGLPIPEGITASEKSIVRKVQTEMGIPPEAKTPSEKEVIRKAKADGLLTPLAGKSKAEKERIIKGLIASRLPIPEGTTPSDKALIRKMRTEAGLPPEQTPSEKKSRIKMKSRGVGAAAAKAAAKAVGAKAGIAEEIEDIAKTTTCDRACGCDKKKIRFKHSYVKIRVTSPDISSLCPCPNECIPGVKGGVFVDNEGIKVTVGTALIIPPFTLKSKMPSQIQPLVSSFEQNHVYLSASCPSFYKPEKENVTQKKSYVDISPNRINSDRTEYYLQYSSNSYKTDSEESISEFYTENDEDYKPVPIDLDFNSEHLDSNITFQTKDDHFTTKSYYTTSCETFRTNMSVALLPRCDVDSTMILSSRSATTTENCDCESIVIVRTESSLSLTSKSHITLGTISVISFNGSVMSSSSVYDSRGFEHTNCNDMVEDAEHFTKEIDYSTADAILSDSELILNKLNSLEKKQESKASIFEDFNLNEEVIVYNVIQKQKMNKLFYHSELNSEDIDKNTRLALKAFDNKNNNKEVQNGKKLKKYNKSRKVVLITATTSKNNTSNENVVILKVSDKTRKNSMNGKRHNKKAIDNCVDKNIFNNDDKLRNDKHFCSRSQHMKLSDSFMILPVSEKKHKERTDNSGQQNIDPIFENKPVSLSNSNSDTHNVLKIVNDLFENERVSAESSSLFVLVRSDSVDSNYSYEDPGSTIGIQLSEELSNMSNIPEIYRMFDMDIKKKMTSYKLHPIPRGLKISTKGKKRKFSSDNDIIDNIEKDYLENHCRIIKPDSDPKKVYHIVGTDTTADRPCCCQPANKCVSNYNILRPCSKTFKGTSRGVYLSISDRTTNVHQLFHEPSLLPLCPEPEPSKPRAPDCSNDAIQALKKIIEQFKIANEALQKQVLEYAQQQPPTQCAPPKCKKSLFQSISSRNSTKSSLSQITPKPDCTPNCSVNLQELKHAHELYEKANYTLQKQVMENTRKACQRRHAAMQPNKFDYRTTPICSRSQFQPISCRSMGTCCLSPMKTMQNQTPCQIISQNNDCQDSQSISHASPPASPGTSRDVYLSRSDRTTNVHQLFHEPSLIPLCPEPEPSKPRAPDCSNDAIQELKKRIEQYKIANEALQKQALEYAQQQQPYTLKQCAPPKCNKFRFPSISSRNSAKSSRSQITPKPDCTPNCSVNLQELKHERELYEKANYTLQKQVMENTRKACQQRLAAMQPQTKKFGYCTTPKCSRSHFQPISSMGTCGLTPLNTLQNQTPCQMISQNNDGQVSQSIPHASPGQAHRPPCKSCCFGPVFGPLGPLPPSTESLCKEQVPTPSPLKSRVSPPAPPQSLASRQENNAQPYPRAPAKARHKGTKDMSPETKARHKGTKDMSPETKSRHKGKKERSKSLQRKDSKLKTKDAQLLSSRSQDAQRGSSQSDVARNGTHARSKSLDRDQKKKKKGKTTYNSVECQCYPSKKKGKKSKKKGGHSKDDGTKKKARVVPPIAAETSESEGEYEKILRQAEITEDTQREINKMKSDLTQTTSGFKVMKKPKALGATSSELNMSFEELLDAFGDGADVPIELQNLIAPPEEFGHESCSCEDKLNFLIETTCNNPKVNCLCPETPEPAVDLYGAEGGAATTSPNPLFDADGIYAKGLKFTIGGKGTNSKGLSGICCFDVTQQDATSDTKLLSDASLSSSEYLWYYK